MGNRWSTTKKPTNAGLTWTEDVGGVVSPSPQAIAPAKMAPLLPGGVTSAPKADDHSHPSAQDTSPTTPPTDQDLDSATTSMERNETNAAPSAHSTLEELHSRDACDDSTTDEFDISGILSEEGSQIWNDYASAQSRFSLDSTGKSFQLPDWFLEHCVTLREEWETEPDDLVLSGSIGTADAPRSLPRLADDARRGNSDVEAAMPYEMEESLFKPLLGLVKTTHTPRCFTTDGIQLQPPQMELPGSDTTSFQMAVVRSLSKAVSADLIVLTTDDVHDITLKYQESTEPLDPRSYKMTLFPEYPEGGGKVSLA